MLVQNVQTNIQFASGIFSFSGEKTAGKTEKGKDGFFNIFDSMTSRNLNFSNGNNDRLNEIAGNQSKINTDTNAPTDTKAPGTKQDVKSALKSVSGKETDAKDPVKEALRAVTGGDEIDEAEFEKVSVCLVRVAVVVTEFFGVEPEQLQGMLDKLGLNASNLADMNSLQQLFVSANCGGDVTQLLTDQTLLDSCTELMDQVSEILEDMGLNHEDIVSMLSGVFGDQKNFRLTMLKASGSEIKETSETKVFDGNEEIPEEQAVTTEKGNEEKTSFEFKSSDDNRANTGSGSKNEIKKTVSHVDMADRFVNTMIAKFEQTITEVSQVNTMTTQLRTIADQILNQIKVNFTPESTSLEIQLTPEHLGKVNVQVQENNGVITAKFQTENQVSKEAIESNLIQFKETLREQGIKVDSIEVTVSDFSFDKDKDAEQNGGSDGERKNKRHFTLDEINERVDGNDLKTQSYIDDGTSTVSYVA